MNAILSHHDNARSRRQCQARNKTAVDKTGADKALSWETRRLLPRYATGAPIIEAPGVPSDGTTLNTSRRSSGCGPGETYAVPSVSSSQSNIR